METSNNTLGDSETITGTHYKTQTIRKRETEWVYKQRLNATVYNNPANSYNLGDIEGFSTNWIEDSATTTLHILNDVLLDLHQDAS